MVHEWSLAEAVIKYVAAEYGNRIRTLSIKIGALQSIDKEIFRFSLAELSGLYGVSIEEIELVDEPVKLKCNVCGHEWVVEPERFDDAIREAIHFLPEAIYSFVACPRCGSRDYRIIAGRGVEVVRVERG